MRTGVPDGAAHMADDSVSISTSLTDHFGECDCCGCPVLEELHEPSGGQAVELVCTSCGMAYMALAPQTDEAATTRSTPARAAA